VGNNPNIFGYLPKKIYLCIPKMSTVDEEDPFIRYIIVCLSCDEGTIGDQ
jgi:hypothetical protein